MYTEKLPAKYESGEHKGEQAYVKITNEKLGYPKTNPILIEQDKFTYPQFGPTPELNDKGEQTNVVTEDQAKDSFAEVAENAGGWVRLLNYVNGSIRVDAVDSGKLYIRTAESAPKNTDGSLDVDSVINTGLKRTLEFTLKVAEKVTAKEMKDTVQNILANLGSLTDEQIAAMIKGLASK